MTLEVFFPTLIILWFYVFWLIHFYWQQHMYICLGFFVVFLFLATVVNLFNISFTDRLLHVNKAYNFGKILQLSCGHNCYGRGNLKEHRPQETPLQGCIMATLALPKLYRSSLSFRGHTTSCCLTALPGRAQSEHLFGQGVLFNDSIVYAPDSFIIRIRLGVGGEVSMETDMPLRNKAEKLWKEDPRL